MVRESGWNTVKLKDICDFIGGGTPSKQVENFWCGNIPWISSSDLIESSIWEINITRHITAEAVAKSATHICPRNTVLVVSRVGVGKVAIAPFEVCTSQDFTNLVSKKHDARFLAYCIQNKMKIMAEKTQGTSIKGVTVENIAQMEIELPPQEEQTAIAEALSDIDNLISSQQKLIEKKKAIKQGTMQELLTGKKRLPGFSGKWTNTTLGRCFSKIVGGGTPSRAISEFWNGEIPWATVKDFATFNPYKTQEYISEAGLNHSSTHLIPKGTLITSTRMGIGKIVIYYVDVAINQDLKALFVSDDVSKEYIYHLFGMVGKIIESLGNGSTVKGIRIEQLKNLSIVLPKKNEQQAIAQVLSDMDSEIEQLEKKLAKYQQIKQGMMQELLTGRIRLKKGEMNV